MGRVHVKEGGLLNLAFTRYCHYQYCIVYIAMNEGRGKTIYCGMVWAIQEGGG